MSESVVTRRGNTNKSDGGVSNTEDFSSFSLALDSENLAGFAGLNTHLGFYNQANGDADTGLDHEKGFAVGANYTFALSEVTEASLLGEWVGIYNSGGGMDDVNYITTSAGLTFYEKWNVAGSYTKRDTDVSGGSDVNDYIYQISAGYAFDNGISFDVGYSGLKESGTNTNFIGALLVYTYEF